MIRKKKIKVSVLHGTSRVRRTPRVRFGPVRRTLPKKEGLHVV